MPSNDGLISHLACLVYLQYLKKNFKIAKIVKLEKLVVIKAHLFENEQS